MFIFQKWDNPLDYKGPTSKKEQTDVSPDIEEFQKLYENYIGMIKLFDPEKLDGILSRIYGKDIDAMKKGSDELKTINTAASNMDNEFQKIESLYDKILSWSEGKGVARIISEWHNLVSLNNESADKWNAQIPVLNKKYGANIPTLEKKSDNAGVPREWTLNLFDVPQYRPAFVKNEEGKWEPRPLFGINRKYNPVEWLWPRAGTTDDNAITFIKDILIPGRMTFRLIDDIILKETYTDESVPWYEYVLAGGMLALETSRFGFAGRLGKLFGRTGEVVYPTSFWAKIIKPLGKTVEETTEKIAQNEAEVLVEGAVIFAGKEITKTIENEAYLVISKSTNKVYRVVENGLEEIGEGIFNKKISAKSLKKSLGKLASTSDYYVVDKAGNIVDATIEGGKIVFDAAARQTAKELAIKVAKNIEKADEKSVNALTNKTGEKITQVFEKIDIKLKNIGDKGVEASKEITGTSTAISKEMLKSPGLTIPALTLKSGEQSLSGMVNTGIGGISLARLGIKYGIQPLTLGAWNVGKVGAYLGIESLTAPLKGAPSIELANIFLKPDAINTGAKLTQGITNNLLGLNTDFQPLNINVDQKKWDWNQIPLKNFPKSEKETEKQPEKKEQTQSNPNKDQGDVNEKSQNNEQKTIQKLDLKWWDSVKENEFLEGGVRLDFYTKMNSANDGQKTKALNALNKIIIDNKINEGTQQKNFEKALEKVNNMDGLFSAKSEGQKKQFA